MIRLLLQSIDPKRDHKKDAPRAFLISNQITEFVFKVCGYFIMLFLVTGLILTSCTGNGFLQIFPEMLTALLFFYIVTNTIGIPLFYVIGKIDRSSVRIIVSWVAIAVLMVLAIWILIASPFMQLLFTYLDKLFPNAINCEAGGLTITPME